jgi:hypothetical protein
MIPAGTNVKYFKVTTLAGVLVGSLNTASFNFVSVTGAYGAAAATYTPSPTPAVAAISGAPAGYYSVTWGLGTLAGFDGLDMTMVSGTNIITPILWGGEVEAYGAAQIAALCARPTVTLSSFSLIGAQQPITLVPYRYRGGSFALTMTIQLGGVAVDLTQFSSFKIAIRDATQAAYKWEASSLDANWVQYAGSVQGNFSITGTNLGILTITIPASLVGPVNGLWLASKKYSLGDCVVPQAGGSNGYVYCCTVAGTTNSTHPAWPTTPGNTVTDNTVTWTCLAKSVWQATTAYNVGDVVTPQANMTPATGGVIMRCVTAGTSGGSEPTWGTTPTTPAAPKADGTAAWAVFNDAFGVLPIATPSVVAYWELTGYYTGTGEEVVIIPSSQCTISRREQGT